jgi:hypothetical protein
MEAPGRGTETIEATDLGTERGREAIEPTDLGTEQRSPRSKTKKKNWFFVFSASSVAPFERSVTSLASI